MNIQQSNNGEHAKITGGWSIGRLILLSVSCLLLAIGVVVRGMDQSIAMALRDWLNSAIGEELCNKGFLLIRPFGKGDVLVLLAFVIGLCGYRRYATSIMLALIITVILVWPLKIIVGRERPNKSDSYSFPSGDSALMLDL